VPPPFICSSSDCTSYHPSSRLSQTPASMISLFFYNLPATTEIYTLSLHDALPISAETAVIDLSQPLVPEAPGRWLNHPKGVVARSEEHTSELQSLRHLVCRILLEKKKYMALGAAIRIMRRVSWEAARRAEIRRSRV